MKYIDSDYENGIKYLRVSLMNTLNAINNNEIKEKSFEYVSWFLLLDCLESLNWKIYEANSVPSGTFIKVDTGKNKIICTKNNRDKIVILNEIH